MTEELLQKLEEKMMVFLAEIETLRQDVQNLKNENANLKAEKENYAAQTETHAKKLKDLLGLFDAIHLNEKNTVSPTSLAILKPMAESVAGA